jgi:signal transduction histidine kinase
MTDFVERLRAGAASVVDLEAAVRTALRDDHAEVCLRSTAGEVYDVTGGQRAVGVPPGRTTCRGESGADLAPVVVHRVGDEPLVGDVLDAGRLAFQSAVLQVELRRQLDELDASRARIVAVTDEERRRLARDLHDGAQQRLVTVGLALRHVQHELNGSAPGEVDRTLDGAVTELSHAIDDLRHLAGGLGPAGLDQGLRSALRELAARSPVAVRLDVCVDRLPSELETAAYFIASEGLTNAVKHAHANRVTVTVSHEGDALTVRVDDDGAGGADLRRGTGLVGLADRTRSHGGTLEIASATGSGTHLTARLPCG